MDAPYDGGEVTVVMEEIESTYTYSSPVPSKKKKKYRSPGDQGEKIKKPRSAYLLYYYDIYLKVQQELPHLPQSAINKKISESWRLLSVAEKSYYLEKAKLEKEGLDPNSKLSSLTAVVPDIPGFRKILPRSDYIIIPKGSLQDEKNKPHVELHVTQGQTALEGQTAATNVTSVSHSTVQNILSVDSSQIGISEQCIAIEGVSEDSTSFVQADTIEEVVASEILSRYVRPAAHKVSGDIFLDEEAPLEAGDGYPCQATSVVIEETLVNTSEAPNGSVTVAEPQASHGVSVVTVVTRRDRQESNSATPTAQFIMMPLTAHSVLENPASIKLTTTYTRRGHGNCTNPGCTFTYVTRHKPPKCPMCGNFLGGKWIPKEKPLKGKSEPGSGLPIKTLGLKKNQLPLTFGQALVQDNPAKCVLESSEAVTQLLNASPVEGQMQETEWEEVIISEAHILANNVQSEEQGGATTIIQLQESLAQIEPSLEQKERENEPSAETANVPSPISHPTSTVKNTTGGDAVGVVPKGLEQKSKAKPKPSLLAAARPMRAILPAPVRLARETNQEQISCGQSFRNSEENSPIRISGLKPNTLKQLGQNPVQAASAEDQKLHCSTNSSTSQVKVVEVKPDVFPSYKYSCTVTLDLGLATLRGRGKCKNPSCTYVYTNRHKPRVCPRCGYNLAKDRTEKAAKSVEVTSSPAHVLNTNEPLIQSQKEIQRQSTLQLLRKVIQIPENESELSDVFALIHELNSSRLILSNMNEETVTIEQTSWSNYYEFPSSQCLLCNSPLFKGGPNSLAGPQECWLLTANRLQVVTAQLKVCVNVQCLALHSFSDIYTGLFNIGNKLLVSLDLLFTIRNHIKLGEDPKVTISKILETVQEHTERNLSTEEVNQLEELLCNGYWAFECLTVRDYNDMICGVCGIAPKVEIAQRNAESVLSLKNIEFTWPEFLASSEVNVEDFWSTMETEVIEQVAFPSSIPITKFDASIIAPFFPPLMRSTIVVNTEREKNLESHVIPGNASALVRLIQDEICKVEQIGSYSEEELQNFLTQCSIPWEDGDSKEQLCLSLLALYDFVQNGTQINQPPAFLTGGKIYKVCPHQVVCGSKYIVRGESPRDHVDLLTSSRHWPPVYVVDVATSVALCADICYPDLTAQMWGRNQGCFSDPMEPLRYVSCPELLDRHYNVDTTTDEHSVEHPITKSTSRFVVHTGTEQKTQSDPLARHRSLSLCRELEPYSAIITAINDSKTNNVRQNPIAFDSATHYYLYNRLIDFLSSREVVNRQIHEIVQSCQPGEVVIRDNLYRLGVAQIKTEMDEDEIQEEEGVV
ncbi:HMG domain-containing protein 3 isoform X1 [Pantherophis guttatus]|uniref:HMG domain-containing protein 3 isoform X1 n=1 Tax=Pantherophis guttatus TaxID=94885 RepID=A0A6P9AJD7_PANGU|nr:HMG domain-containing protein 3 isoform X1 [Pantherophis guttatus]